jgi:hypothetical protein
LPTGRREREHPGNWFNVERKVVLLPQLPLANSKRAAGEVM